MINEIERDLLKNWLDINIKIGLDVKRVDWYGNKGYMNSGEIWKINGYTIEFIFYSYGEKDLEHISKCNITYPDGHVCKFSVSQGTMSGNMEELLEAVFREITEEKEETKVE